MRANNMRRSPAQRAWWPRAMRLAVSAGLVCAVGLGSLFAPPLCAQLRDERAVKAAFVFNLTKYVEWPHPNQELTIAFIGDGAMGGMLQKMLDGKISESRPIHIVPSPSDEQLQHCDILYIAQSSAKKIHAAVDKVRNKAVLTVGDSESFAINGGMVGLVRMHDQIDIRINLQATEEAHLKISSRVLDLSTIVETAQAARN